MSKSRDTISYSKATIGCVCLLVSAVALYLYFLNMSVVQVVMRTESVQEQRELQAEIAALEAKYIEAQHVIAARIATLEGYNTDIPKIFVSRADTSLVYGGQ
ncbi:hypothetical protein H6786_01880 [Candidatus Nomurabacteria bacterium]|nr:hypothetical protein [Candidatus Nomurabacteria bacterium]